MIKYLQEIKKNTQLKAFSAAESQKVLSGVGNMPPSPPPRSSLQYILQDDHRSILLFPNFFKLLVKTNLSYK
jgi:hypothetical protein